MKMNMKYSGTCAVAIAILMIQHSIVFGQSAEPAARKAVTATVTDLEKQGPGFPFSMTETNHFYVEVKLNGEGPFRLIFDLGAPVTLISNRAARESKTVPPGRRPSLFMGMSGEGVVKEMQFGESTAKDIPVMIFDHPAINAMSEILGKRFDGILGYTFFARYRTTIDYQKKRLWFEPVQESTDNIVTALPERMMNLSAKAQTRVVVPRSQAIGIEIEMQEGDKSNAIPPVVKIAKIRKDSPADKAGLKPGDAFITFGPHWLFSPADLADALSGSETGQPIEIQVKRDAETLKYSVVPEPVF